MDWNHQPVIVWAYDRIYFGPFNPFMKSWVFLGGREIGPLVLQDMEHVRRPALTFVMFYLFSQGLQRKRAETTDLPE